MKIYIAQNQSEELEKLGHLRIGDFSKIDIIIDDAECTDIVIQDLSFVSYDDLKYFLEKIVSKLRLGGKISICSPDVYSLSLKLIRKLINASQFNEIVFGEGGSVRCIHDLKAVQEVLSELGLEITEKKYVSSYLVVSGVRNGN